MLTLPSAPLPEGYHPGVGPAYMAPWLPLCQMEFRPVGGADKSDTQGRNTHTMHRPLLLSGFLSQEAGDHGRQMCPQFPQKPLLLSSAWSLLMGRGHLGQDLLSAKVDEAMTDLFLPKRVLDTSSTEVFADSLHSSDEVTWPGHPQNLEGLSS